ncbi:hypothetical protein B0H21DRAFT_779494 [Amylocystis lapponica]|nr:hypothetical protein B0H21DRAFT_779494 [Amylocystis lapponica]
MKKREAAFWTLQNDILDAFGTKSLEHPKLETSVTLECSPLEHASAKLRSLNIYRNRQRLAAIPSPDTNTFTKLSDLHIDTVYTFKLVLRTTAGVFPSNLLPYYEFVLLKNAKLALLEMSARWSEKNQINTTHSVCTTPAVTPGGAQAFGSVTTTPGIEYQKALQLRIPVTQPHWILASRSERIITIMPIHPYYLGANPTPLCSGNTRPQSMSQANRGPVVARLEPAPEEREPSSLSSDEEDSGRNGAQAQAQGHDDQLQRTKTTPEPARLDVSKEVGLTALGVIEPSSVEVPPPPPVNNKLPQSVLESTDELG